MLLPARSPSSLFKVKFLDSVSEGKRLFFAFFFWVGLLIEERSRHAQSFDTRRARSSAGVECRRLLAARNRNHTSPAGAQRAVAARAMGPRADASRGWERGGWEAARCCGSGHGAYGPGSTAHHKAAHITRLVSIIFCITRAGIPRELPVFCCAGCQSGSWAFSVEYREQSCSVRLSKGSLG